eukprot:m.36038 g.36038  ORF g.36038 m.36038 type:complete len:60 (-) comp11223_c0_seq1:347-526(-)
MLLMRHQSLVHDPTPSVYGDQSNDWRCLHAFTQGAVAGPVWLKGLADDENGAENHTGIA